MRNLLLILIAIFTLATPLSALACTPPPGGPIYTTPTEHAIAAPIIVEGTVTTLSWNGSSMVGTIQVMQYLKGSGAQTIEVSGYGMYPSCLTEISIGEHSIFYIKVEQNGQWRAHQIHSYDATSPATPEIINEIRIALTIRYTPTPTYSSATATPPPTTQSKHPVRGTSVDPAVAIARRLVDHLLGMLSALR